MIKNTLKEFSIYALTVSLFILVAFVVNTFYLSKGKEENSATVKPSTTGPKTQKIFYKL